jgi:3-phosphoshikimate 1-carboxyvinyltransferase
MRMLTGVLVGQPFDTELIGDHSLSRRPMRRVIEPLSQMGASIDATDGHAPLTVHGRRLTPIHYAQTVPSAQVKSAILLAGLHADGTTAVTEPARTRDHTERALAAFGFEAPTVGLTTSIRGQQRGVGQSLPVPGDFSSAAFWMVAAAALPGSVVTIDDVGLNPTRTALIGVLRRFGAHVDVRETSTAAGEPIGTIIVTGDRTGSIQIAAHEVPELIDELPAIAALAAHSGEVRVDGAQELRVKESDRIAALVTGFRALGIRAASPTPPAIIVSPWRLRSRRLPPKRRRGSKAPTSWRSPTRDFLKHWPGSSRENRQGLPRRLHGCRQKLDCPRAGAAPRLACRRRGRDDRAA